VARDSIDENDRREKKNKTSNSAFDVSPRAVPSVPSVKVSFASDGNHRGRSEKCLMYVRGIIPLHQSTKASCTGPRYCPVYVIDEAGDNVRPRMDEDLPRIEGSRHVDRTVEEGACRAVNSLVFPDCTEVCVVDGTEDRSRVPPWGHGRSSRTMEKSKPTLCPMQYKKRSRRR
jgi:hypothetical protein